MSDARGVGQLALVRCSYCSIKRYYRPEDLEEIFGNVDVDGIAGRMRCDRCKKRDFLHAKLVLPTAAERQTIRVRRLAEIRVVRKVIWRDE
jgi:hypothetical protein